MIECPEVANELMSLHNSPDCYFTRMNDRQVFEDHLIHQQLGFIKGLSTLRKCETVQDFIDFILKNSSVILVRKQDNVIIELCANNP